MRKPQFTYNIVTRNNSLEIWAVKLRFLLIYENMLKSIATAHSKSTTKHEKHFWRWLKKDQNTNWTKKYLYLWKILYWLTIGLLLVFPVNFLSIIWKNNFLTICIPYKKSKPNSLISELFSNKRLNDSLIKQMFVQKLLQYIFVLRWNVSKSIKKIL